MAASFRPTASVSTHLKSITAATRSPAIVGAVDISTLEKRKLPVLLFDVMDTIVRDPFYYDIPAFFKISAGFKKDLAAKQQKTTISDTVKMSACRMSMRELLEEKHPTAWVEFEKGLIDEVSLEKFRTRFDGH